MGQTPRTLIFSQRNLSRMVYQCGKYEFEDVVRDLEAADLVAPTAPVEPRLARLGRRVLNRARRQIKRPMDLPMTATRVERDYEIFFAPLLFPAEVVYLKKLEGWQRRCAKKVCFLGEVWNKDREALRLFAPLLREFDHLFVHVSASLPMVADLIGRPCHQLSVAVDALRFSPFPVPPARTVDCYSMGRRSAVTHDALMRLGARPSPPFYYVYDTVRNFEVIDTQEHRRLVAETIKRSRYFIAYKHNVNASDQTGGDEALGSRLFEGVAGGAVVLGIAPDCPEFATHFDWPDAVVPIAFEPADLEATLAAIDADPERVARIRAANVSASLRRHDWSCRWQTILKTIGLEPTSSLLSRRARLDDLATLAERQPTTFGRAVAAPVA
jgi:hypothetical protein